MSISSFFQALTVGRDLGQPFKMLIVGETGSGKTSFLNLLYNCSKVQEMGHQFDESGMRHFQSYHDQSLENERSKKMESKTSSTKRYNICLGALKVAIIDTPGFGDSRGFSQDKKNAKTIMDALQEEDYIHCVCLIINGRQARTSVSLQYVLTEITSIMPKEILNNVIVVFSNTSDQHDLNFDSGSLADYFGKKPGHIFYIENPYCRYERVKGGADFSKQSRKLKRAFEETAEELQNMCESIQCFNPVHTQRFTNLYSRKQAIERGVLEMLTTYDNQLRLEKALKNAREKLDAAKSTKDLNSAFQETQQFSRWIVVKTERHNTLCGAANCYSNCHVRCNLAKSMDKNIFKSCACMGANNTCQQCGHSYIHHYHNEALFKEELVKHEMVDKDMVERFKKAKSEEEQLKMVYDKIQRQHYASEQERKKLAANLYTKIEEFQTLGVARNYAKLIENQLAVIETRIEGTTGAETKHLRKTKEELEKKLILVHEAMSCGGK